MSNDFSEFIIDRIEVFLVNGNNINAPNVTPEKIEKEVERKLRQNFSQYLGPKLGNTDEELVTFRFNHLKK